MYYIIEFQSNEGLKIVKELQKANLIKLKKVSYENSLSEGKKKTWESIKRGFEELALVKEGKLKSTPIQDVLNEL